MRAAMPLQDGRANDLSCFVIMFGGRKIPPNNHAVAVTEGPMVQGGRGRTIVHRPRDMAHSETLVDPREPRNPIYPRAREGFNYAAPRPVCPIVDFRSHEEGWTTVGALG